MVQFGNTYGLGVFEQKLDTSDSEDNIFLMLPSISSLLSDIELEVRRENLAIDYLFIICYCQQVLTLKFMINAAPFQTSKQKSIVSTNGVISYINITSTLKLLHQRYETLPV